ncbi:MAG TPA: response regulator [Chloroflexota bacterium]|nr:response regulator [Chloroflexota bacterium]
MTAGESSPETLSRRQVLIIDDDRDIADLVHAILTDEGYAVSVLHDQDAAAIRTAINLLEPDCVLLDGKDPHEYGEAWDDAAWMRGRDRRVPLIMFSAHAMATQEAEASETPRSRAAGFAGIVPKPFDLDHLITQVAAAVGLAEPFDMSEPAEQRRTAALVARLNAAGAREIHVSTRREWSNFRTEDGTLVQMYWWQRDGVYYVVRHAETGGVLETIGRFYDLDAAITLAMTVRR